MYLTSWAMPTTYHPHCANVHAPSLIEALHHHYTEKTTWLASYKEEYDRLKEFNTFEELTFAEYHKLAL
jgi:hypothetical protein